MNTENEQLIITNKESGEIKQVPIEDIGFAVLEHPQISITQSAIRLMTENNVAVIFCNEKYMPASMLLHLDANHLQNEVFAQQIAATEPLKKQLWKQTIEAKIKNQALLLKKNKREYKLLLELGKAVKSGDSDNREAVAAKHYWQQLFLDKAFKRDRFGLPPNPSLNYGYAILRAAVARALTGSGLLATLGIHHHNRYNAYCLADDIMEPFRPYVDEIVIKQLLSGTITENLIKEQKAELLTVLTRDMIYDNVTRPLMVGLSITTASLSKCFAGVAKKIDFPEFE